MAHKKAGSSSKNGRYRAAGYSFEDIEGSIRLVGSTAEIEALRAKVAEGEAFLSGNVRFEHQTAKKKRVRVIPAAEQVAAKA